MTPSSGRFRSSRRGRLFQAWARVHAWGMQRLRRLWLPSYLLPPFPGVVAHHRPPGLAGLVFGHGKAFSRATLVRGVSASTYFRDSGIQACARDNAGICSFRLGTRIALYQIDNRPLLPDEYLAPSLDANQQLFGEFMGSRPHGDPVRRDKRLAVEATLGSARFVDGLGAAIRSHARDFLARATARDLPLDEFCLHLVTHVDSLVPGVLDLGQRPLTQFLSSPEHGHVVRAFFEIASDVITNVNPDAVRNFDAIVPFVRAVLEDNFECLANASETNLIRRQFAVWHRPFSRAAVAALDAASLKELGTVIVATYDTTYLSLQWAIAYIESNPVIKRAVICAARNHTTDAALSLLDLVVLEAVRLGGSNPTALWRRSIRPFKLPHGEREVVVPSGTMLWLDRRAANQDPQVFPRPCVFTPDNIRAILRSDKETVSSILSRGRYEINSFSMVNTERNPRKCPGRLFSVRMQSTLLAELYGRHDVTSHGIDLRLRRHSAMPRPARPGVIRLIPQAVHLAGAGQ